MSTSTATVTTLELPVLNSNTTTSHRASFSDPLRHHSSTAITPGGSPLATPDISRRGTWDDNAQKSSSSGGANGDDDIEAIRGDSATVAREAGELDPLLLRGRIVGDGELSELRNRKGKAGRRSTKVANFYDAQNEHIESLLKPLHVHTSDAQQAEDDNKSQVKWAIRLSFLANFALAILQLYAAISSLSLSLFATAIDAVFDPFANLLLNVLHKKALKADEKKWPMGGSRFESIGNIVYGGLMGMVNLILIVESIRSVATHSTEADGETNTLHIPSLVAVGVAFLTKFALFIYCFSIRRQSSQVQVLFEDHRNDLFVNGFGIFTSAAGAKIAWWLDPMGAMIIAVCIMFSWSRTIYGECPPFARFGGPVRCGERPMN